MNSLNEYPLDIASLKEIGIDTWQKEMASWPMTDAASMDLKRDLQHLYYDLLKRAIEKPEHALVVQFKFTLVVETIFHYLFVIQKLNNENRPIKNSKSTEFYIKLAEGQVSEIEIKAYMFRLLKPINQGLKARLIGKSEAKLNHIRYKIKGQAKLFPGRNCVYSILGPPGIELNDHVANNGSNVKFVYPYPLFYRGANPNAAEMNSINDLALTFQAGLNKIADKFDIEPPQNLVNNITDCFKILLDETLVHLDEIAFYFNNKRKSKVLISSIGITPSRLFAVGAKLGDQDSVSAIHGNNVGTIVSDTTTMINFAPVSSYVVPSKGSKEIYTQAKNKSPYLVNKPLNIVSTDSEYYKLKQIEHGKKEVPKNVNSVMLVEFPLTETRYHNVLSFWPYQLDIMLRTGIFLKEIGVRTVLKAHPDRLKDSNLLYNNYFDEIITDRPFEQVYDKCDALAFTDLGTTTLGFSITTNLPIFVYQSMFEFLPKDMHEMFAKRCHVIPSWIDDRSQLQFDKEHFRKIINGPVNSINNEFLETFM